MLPSNRASPNQTNCVTSKIKPCSLYKNPVQEVRNITRVLRPGVFLHFPLGFMIVYLKPIFADSARFSAELEPSQRGDLPRGGLPNYACESSGLTGLILRRARRHHYRIHKCAKKWVKIGKTMNKKVSLGWFEFQILFLIYQRETYGCAILKELAQSNTNISPLRCSRQRLFGDSSPGQQPPGAEISQKGQCRICWSWCIAVCS